MSYEFVKLKDRSEMKERAASWFSAKWGIAQEIYLKHIEAYITSNTDHGWYLCLHNGDEIIGGIGVIENDFHERKDLRPNICALYVEAKHRRKGIAKKLLALVVDDMKEKGIDTLYLVSDLKGFYERCGWQYLGKVKEDDGQHMIDIFMHKV